MSMRPPQVILTIMRWVALVGLCLVGLFFLNDAFFSGWVAGGPPGPHKLGWERRSLASLVLSLASLVAAAGAFRSLGSFPRGGKLGWCLIVVAAGMALAPFVAREILVDSCLDGGGRWSHAALECEQ